MSIDVFLIIAFSSSRARLVHKLSWSPHHFLFLTRSQGDCQAAGIGAMTAARNARQNLPEDDDESIPNDEVACFYLAMEILLPEMETKSNGNLRAEAMEMYLQNNKDIRAIAKRFRIPEKIVMHFFERGYSERSTNSRATMSTFSKP